MKKTKIVSTLGPASFHVDVIAKLIKAGVNVFRFNFSHGDHKQHLHTYHMVQQAEKKVGQRVGIDCDTKGAEIRTTANVGGKNFTYHKGDKFRIAMDSTGKKPSTEYMIQSTYTGLFNDVHLGGHVLFDDGILDTIVSHKDNDRHLLTVTVQNNATLGSRKTIDIPGAIVHLPGVTKKDANDIKFACENLNINFITASFLREPKDVLAIRKILKETHMEDVQIFPKLENQQGVDNLVPIMKVADGVMVPRGDMAVNIPYERVPLIQKHMVHYCNKIGKPVIVATQMLASMAQNPRPSRAEVSDVADAVWDGTDATMLSGETAAGNWPVHAVKAMAKIDKEAENHYTEYGYPRPLPMNRYDGADAIARATTRWANQLKVKTIVINGDNIHLARMFSKYHPNANILALTTNQRAQGALTINWGIDPILVKDADKNDFSTIKKQDFNQLAQDYALEQHLAKPGSDIIIITDKPTYSTHIMAINETKPKLI